MTAQAPTAAQRRGVERTATVRVDWPLCEARGLCAALLPERVGLDEWGYPIVDDPHLAPDDAPDAATAVRLCPARALYTAP